MTAMNDYAHERLSPSWKTVALTLLLGFAALVGFAGIQGALKPSPELWIWPRLILAAVSLLIGAGALRGLSRLEPSSVKNATVMMVLISITLLGYEATKGVVQGLIATDTLWGPWAWQTTVILAKNLLLLLIGIGGFLWLKPWKVWRGSDEPVSPKTRRTHTLFWLSGLVTVPGVLALADVTRNQDDRFALFSNSAVPPGIATFAIVSWLLGMALSWWWYISADEHERHAYGVGILAGGGLFMTVTPAWWIAARADLLPQPDAMVLWVATMTAATIGWIWRRSL